MDEQLVTMIEKNYNTIHTEILDTTMGKFHLSVLYRQNLHQHTPIPKKSPLSVTIFLNQYRWTRHTN